ncbi:hypothetical protein K435DRAFT_859268 [Dendrothele bispora CBS 962.96]|uniref:Uncharacterized protein n=1 Tax=Dendrothele bispora (strain CBS 962.96) TaxID=1314807 RepID=A0A4S8M203_DENBC|nr:hypothetical protein K435DRAFT_859268 [Dendrothele bispora CBS 962.96]
MTLRPILKAMPKYRRAQRSSASSSHGYTSTPPSAPSTPNSPENIPFTSVSPPTPPRPQQHLSSTLPSPRLRSPLLSPHVHFPPTPAISSTQLTHSPSTYDRAPIQVSPNSCELPERGGRVYDEIGSPDSVCHAPRSKASKGSYFHPSAFEACETEVSEEPSSPPVSVSSYPGSSSASSSANASGVSSPTDPSQYLQVPSLVHDLLLSSSSSSCSESEDSDLSPNPYIESTGSPFSIQSSPDSPPYFGPHSPYHHSYSLSNHLGQEELAHALSFLPYSPAQRKEPSSNTMMTMNDLPCSKQKARKRHSRKTLRGDQTPRLSRRCSQNDWDSTTSLEEGCLGGF